MRSMRTTIDLPEDLHRAALAVAHDSGKTLSATVSDVLRKALFPLNVTVIDTDQRTGLPIVTLGRVITSDDVRSLEDE